MLFFIRYFISYVFKAKTRQGLIVLVVLALALCSFALTLLQATMHGLQNSMMKRYQSVEGAFYLTPKNQSDDSVKVMKLVQQALKQQNIEFYPALVLEVLLKQGEYIAPALLTAIDSSKSVPNFLSDQDFSGIILGADLGAKLKSGPSTSVKIFSPSHSIALLGDVPQFVTEEVSGFALSGFEDIDSIRAWARLPLAQNLIREEKLSHLIFYNESLISKVQQIIAPFAEKIDLVEWKDQRTELMWAFNLETVVMISIFTMMVVLISLTIVSSCSLFFNKVHLEMFVFWLLGESNVRIKRALFLTFQCIILASVLGGLSLGVMVLLYLDIKNPIIMPDVFLERSIPIHFSIKHMVYSFFIPYLVASIFVYWSLRDFFLYQSSYSSLIKRVE
jgi:lipoprotein-releasing system permease protein